MGSITTTPEPTPGQYRVLVDITAERARQDAKWGRKSHLPLEWLSILLEEVGEVAQAVNENHWSGACLDNYRVELIEVAAVAVAAIECLDWYKSYEEEMLYGGCNR